MADWVRECARSGLGGPGGPSGPATYPEIAANAVLVLLAVACALLNRQIAALAAAFENEGGFTERLYRVRSTRAVHKVHIVHSVHRVHRVHTVHALMGK